MEVFKRMCMWHSRLQTVSFEVLIPSVFRSTESIARTVISITATEQCFLDLIGYVHKGPRCSS